MARKLLPPGTLALLLPALLLSLLSPAHGLDFGPSSSREPGPPELRTRARAPKMQEFGRRVPPPLPSPAQTSNGANGRPYLDESGQICQDRMETVEETEYDKQIHCRVHMEEECEEEEEDYEMDEACHTMYKKECSISYRPQMTKVKVKVCPDGGVRLVRNKASRGRGHDVMEAMEEEENSVVIDVRPRPSDSGKTDVGRCRAGRRKICVTKHETECKTEQVRHEMEEDHPRCRVELVERCQPETEVEGPEVHPLFRMEKKKKNQCQRVPAMRCKIEKMMVMKTKPETKCERVPRQFCRKEECHPDLDGEFGGGGSGSGGGVRSERARRRCYFKNQIVNEIIPEESCRLRPHRMCHKVRRSRGQSRSQGQSRRQVRLLQQNRRRRRRRHAGRDSRVFFPSPSTESARNSNSKMRANCQRRPVQQCETRRANPRPVSKQMRRQNCRAPRPESAADRSLVRRLIAQMIEDKMKKRQLNRLRRQSGGGGGGGGHFQTEGGNAGGFSEQETKMP